MSTLTASRPTTPSRIDTTVPASPARRFFGVVARPQSYRNIAYLLLGLPLGTLWFALLVSGVAVAVSLLVVALLGIPMLFGLWYLTRGFANVERATANALLGEHLAHAPMTWGDDSNLWARLHSMTSDRSRWRELGYLLLRFPIGIATFTAAVVALAVPGLVAYAPFAARHNDAPFGDWALSARMEDVASSPWAWFLVPLSLVLLVVSFHLLNALARGCGRWTRASLRNE